MTPLQVGCVFCSISRGGACLNRVSLWGILLWLHGIPLWLHGIPLWWHGIPLWWVCLRGWVTIPRLPPPLLNNSDLWRGAQNTGDAMGLHVGIALSAATICGGCADAREGAQGAAPCNSKADTGDKKKNKRGNHKVAPRPHASS